MPTLSHACVRVLDLARSVAFYRETLGLTPQRELTMEDRGWHLVFLGDGVTPFQLELCRELQRTEPYRLGDDTPHVALVSQDFQGLKAKHQARGLSLMNWPTASTSSKTPTATSWRFFLQTDPPAVPRYKPPGGIQGACILSL